MVYIDGKEYQRYPVAVGRGSTPTPIRVQDCAEEHELEGVRDPLAGAQRSLGNLRHPRTNKPWSIGTQASAGASACLTAMWSSFTG